MRKPTCPVCRDKGEVLFGHERRGATVRRCPLGCGASAGKADERPASWAEAGEAMKCGDQRAHRRYIVTRTREGFRIDRDGTVIQHHTATFAEATAIIDALVA